MSKNQYLVELEKVTIKQNKSKAKETNQGSKLSNNLIDLLFLFFFSDVCEGHDFHCGGGFCVAFEAKCNGFQDCYNDLADELRCG